MAGRIITNKKTGEKRWWDDATQSMMPLSQAESIGAQEEIQSLDNLDESADRYRNVLETRVDQPKQDLLPPKIRKEGQQAAVKDANQVSGQLTRNVVVPMAQAGLAAATGGMSLPYQVAIGGGAELASQAMGFSDPSATQVGLAAAMPWGGQKLAGAFKAGGRMTANMFGKGQQAGEEAAATTLGLTKRASWHGMPERDVPLDVIERSTHAPSKALYKAAENQGPLNTSGAFQVIDDAIQKEVALGSQADPVVLKKLKGMANDFNNNPSMDAADMVAKVQRLQSVTNKAFKQKNTPVAAALKDTTGQLKPVAGLGEADQAYSRESVVDDIFGALRKGNKLKAVDDLIADQGDKMQAVMSRKDIGDIRKIAHQMADIGTNDSGSGLVKSTYDKLLRSFISDPNGLTVFRHAFGPDLSKMTKHGMAGIATFVRGYAAMKAKEQGD